MLKAIAGTTDGRRLIVLGLSRENCNRLLKDKPIMIEGPDIGIEYDILIFGAEDEAALEKIIRSAMKGDS